MYIYIEYKLYILSNYVIKYDEIILKIQNITENINHPTDVLMLFKNMFFFLKNFI